MKKLIVILALVLHFAGFAQEEKKETKFYFNTEFSTPLRGNDDPDDEINYVKNQEKYWFLPDGLSVRAGSGFHYRRSIFLGLHTGIDLKGTAKFVAVPVFANLKIAPRLSKTDEMRLFVNLGYGHAFALGRGDLSGKFMRGTLGIEGGVEDKRNLSFFIDVSYYEIPLKNNPEGIGSISLGIALTFF